MPIRRTSAPPLDPALRRLLIEGPHAIGKNLTEIPRHDELAEVWRVHGESILASLGPRQRAWFMERDWFVQQIRGAHRRE